MEPVGDEVVGARQIRLAGEQPLLVVGHPEEGVRPSA
jgi:hypothetical protein